MKKSIGIIGSGFSSLSAACYLAKEGHEVHVFEKNESIGGRASQFKAEGFTFDMGPSWYWMPDVFERFFNDFNYTTKDLLELKKLNPAYSVFFDDQKIDIKDNLEDIYNTFEDIEKGSAEKLKEFIADAKSNYDVAIKDVVYRPGISPLELVTPKTVKKLGQFFSNISGMVRKKVKNPKLVSILEFPVLFLGAKPKNTPAFYNFMNYADFGLGTWQPKGGMHQVILAMKKIATEHNVQFYTNSNVSKIITDSSTAKGIIVNNEEKLFDIVLSGADYHHTETLLDSKNKQYSEEYWDKKTFAPSSLLYYLGFNKKLENVSHHNLFFDADFEKHAQEIYDQPEWPSDPLFYANFTSITHPETAPNGMENAFLLMPLAPGLHDSEELREKYFNIMIDRLEKKTGQSLKDSIVYKKSFGVTDFKERYNSYKGNAYGMVNTLLQTAFLRPGLKSKKVKNLFFTGQLTVPGPGVPPALISGKLVAGLINKNLNA